MKICTTILVLHLFITFVNGQSSYGYFDFDKIIAELPDYKNFNDSINIHRQQINDTIDMMIFESNTTSFGKTDTNWMTPRERKMYDYEKNDEQMRISEYKKSAEKRIDKEILDRRTKLIKILQDPIKDFFNKNDIIILADKRALLYCNNCKDYSADIIEFIKNKK